MPGSPHTAAALPPAKRTIVKYATERQSYLISADGVEQVGLALRDRPPARWYTAIIPAAAIFFAGLPWQNQAEWVEPVTIGATATILIGWVGLRMGVRLCANVCLEVARQLRDKAKKFEEKTDA